MGKLRFWHRRGREGQSGITSLIYVGRRRTVGLNLHWSGGISLTGLPASGGTTLCWGRLRRKCAASDARQDDPQNPVQLSADLHIQRTRVRTAGPLMVRVGSNF